ncbi:MAG: sulfite exporter TauE/SafE family protein [Verrucomicrobiae bacterium]|nr:sulfite exporter TauE/SafE family protein [Verrucomicrobiae bacterium]
MRRLWPWFLWLTAFYAVWLGLVITGSHWQTLRDHYGIAIAMALGSYVAGSTPMGGGTVGFPILVLLFGLPATLGRDFSFAVQSIGMTSASIFILSRRQRLEWVLLRWALVGSLLGTPLGILFVAPHIPGGVIKVVFAVTWASFGVLHLYRINAICSNIGETPAAHAFDRKVGFTVGFLGALTVASVTGVGIDMVLYAVMVLLMRSDLKSAIPSSVIVMAFTSLVGVATKKLLTGFEPGVYENWLAAAPVVALGAPLGVFIVSRIGRKPTLLVVAVLCIGQFFWTMHQEFAVLGATGLAAAILGVALMNGGFEWLWRIGDRLERRSVPMILPKPPRPVLPPNP